MARQRCCGLVEEMPSCRLFIPEGRRRVQPVLLGLEELEAIRLKDHCDKEQVDCAADMGVSRATFQRILRSARTKIANALVEGRPIMIQGGNYIMKNRVFECLDCGKQWEEAPCSAGGKHGYELPCPACGSLKKTKIAEDGSKQACGHSSGEGHGHAHGGGCCGGHHHHD